MNRRRLWAVVRAIALIVALQAALLALYIFVERSRAPAEGHVPELAFLHEDRSRGVLAHQGERHVLVHFWATWCPPCRREIPTLLALAEDGAFRDRIVVLAVSVDEDWPALTTFFDGRIPKQVVRAEDSTAHARFGGTKLPDTFLISPEGRVRGRFEGARDWSQVAVRREIMAMLDSSRRF